MGNIFTIIGKTIEIWRIFYLVLLILLSKKKKKCLIDRYKLSTKWQRREI